MKANVSKFLKTLQAGIGVSAAIMVLSACADDKDDGSARPTAAENESSDAENGQELEVPNEGMGLCAEESGECSHGGKGSTGGEDKHKSDDALENVRFETFNRNMNALFVFKKGAKVVAVKVNGKVFVKDSKEVAINSGRQIVGEFGEAEVGERQILSRNAQQMMDDPSELTDVSGKPYYYLDAHQSSVEENKFELTVEYKGKTQTIKQSDAIEGFGEMPNLSLPGMGGFHVPTEH